MGVVSGGKAQFNSSDGSNFAKLNFKPWHQNSPCWTHNFSKMWQLCCNRWARAHFILWSARWQKAIEEQAIHANPLYLLQKISIKSWQNPTPFKLISTTTTTNNISDSLTPILNPKKRRRMAANMATASTVIGLSSSSLSPKRTCLSSGSIQICSLTLNLRLLSLKCTSVHHTLILQRNFFL